MQQAKRLNVIVKASKKEGKKIDVFTKDGKYITSIGAKGYLDYPYYLKYYGKQIADKKRKLYKIRHAKDRMIKFSRGWFADQLLW